MSAPDFKTPLANLLNEEMRQQLEEMVTRRVEETLEKRVDSLVEETKRRDNRQVKRKTREGKKSITLVLEEQTAAEFKARAKEEGVPMQQKLHKLVQNYLKSGPEKEKIEEKAAEKEKIEEKKTEISEKTEINDIQKRQHWKTNDYLACQIGEDDLENDPGEDP